MIAGRIQEAVRFVGPRGALSGELVYAVDRPLCAVLLAGPHPYMGGSMQNILLLRLAEALADAGCVALRFDYSGTGGSEGPPCDVQAAMSAFWMTGEAPQDPTLIEDARAAAQWLEETCRLSQVIVGYSFGALAASRASSESTVGLSLIAPTLKQHQIVLPSEAHLHCQLIRAGRDFATPASVTTDWIRSSRPDLNVQSFEEADHFFRGVEIDAADCCVEFCVRAARGSIR